MTATTPAAPVPAGTEHPLLRLALFRIRTFRAAVSGSFFSRLGMGGVVEM